MASLAARYEAGVWRSLALALRGRRPGTTPTSTRFSYTQDLGPLLGAFLFVSLIELPVLHFLIPWDGVRLAALVVGVWGLLWMAGFLAAVRVFPHLVDDDALRVRYAFLADVRVPLEAVDRAVVARRSLETGTTVQTHEDDDGVAVSVAAVRQTRVDVRLRAPTRLELPDGPRTVGEIRLYVDDPRGFVSAVRERLARRGAAAGPPHGG